MADSVMSKILVVTVLSAICGQMIGVDGSMEENTLRLSPQYSTWDDAQLTCSFLADKSVFCSENDSTKCSPEIPSYYDVSNLPDTFMAWVNSILFNSYIIAFKGCYEVPETKHHFFTKIEGRNDLKDCAFACASNIEYIGITDNDCYCILDALISTVSPAVKVISSSECTDTANITKPDFLVIDIYYRYATTLLKDKCPLAYNLGKGTAFLGAENCEHNNTYYCEGSGKEHGPDVWNDAIEKCSNMSGRVVHMRELDTTGVGKYWLSGYIFKDFTFNKRRLDDTRCTALSRDVRGEFKFHAVNCSTELYSLCLGNTLSTTETAVTDEDEVTVTTNAFQVSVTTYDANTTVKTGPGERHVSTLPKETKYIPPSTVVDETRFEPSADASNGSITGIVVGIIVVMICLAIIVFVYYRRKKKQAEERQLHHKSTFQSFEGHPDEITTQTMRYLPSTMTYPPGYSVGNLEMIDELSKTHTDGVQRKPIGDRYQVEVNATIHNEVHTLHTSDNTGNQNAQDDEKVDQQGNDITKQSDDCDHVVKDDKRYISFAAREKGDNNKTLEEDKYVSMLSPEAALHIKDCSTDPGEIGNEDVAGKEFVNERPSVHKDISDIRKTEPENNVNVETLNTSNDSNDTVQKMAYVYKKNEGNSGIDEVDNSILRSLIEDENNEFGLSSEILRNSFKQERTDSAIYK